MSILKFRDNSLGYYYPLEVTKGIKNIMSVCSHWKKRIEKCQWPCCLMISHYHNYYHFKSVFKLVFALYLKQLSRDRLIKSTLRKYMIQQCRNLRTCTIAKLDFTKKIENIMPVCSYWKERLRNLLALKREFHGSAHARILTGKCTLSGTGPGFSLFMNQS